jgi:glyoxylase-like metal-dependent hydrolase (beta-lactamase superfamily II)
MRLVNALTRSVLVLWILTLGVGTFAQQQEPKPIQPIPVTDTIHVIDLGVNIAAFTGPDGVLLVDSGYKNQAPRLQQAIADAFAQPVRYLLNTHLNYDHVGGNERLAQGGAVIVAHETTRRRMTEEWRVGEVLGMPVIPPFPQQALPVLCFRDTMTIHFNNETVQLIHIPGGHTDCDAIVRFREANVIHTGDLFYSHSFPVFEGKVDGCIAAVDEILQSCDDETRIIPGHGPVSDRAGLVAYREMLVAGRNRIDSLVEEGHTLEEIVAMDPISELCPGGKCWAPPRYFIYCVVHGLSIGNRH